MKVKRSESAKSIHEQSPTQRMYNGGWWLGMIWARLAPGVISDRDGFVAAGGWGVQRQQLKQMKFKQAYRRSPDVG